MAGTEGLVRALGHSGTNFMSMSWAILTLTSISWPSARSLKNAMRAPAFFQQSLWTKSFPNLSTESHTWNCLKLKQGLTKHLSSRGLPGTWGYLNQQPAPQSSTLWAPPVHQGHMGGPLPIRLSVLPYQDSSSGVKWIWIHSQLPATTLANGPHSYSKRLLPVPLEIFVLFFLSFLWLSENGFAHKGT